jgi:hypothetical protein
MSFPKSESLLRMCAAVMLLTLDYTPGVNPAINGHNTQLARPKIARIPKGGILNLTLRSNIDGSLQPLIVQVPEDYSPKEKWPLLVTLHGLGDGPILATEVKSMVQIGPYGRGSVWFTGIGAQDVFECVEVAKKLFSIDEDRLYLCGFSMGGIATFNLGLKYLDLWAACVPVCGRCEDVDWVENGRHVPFWIHTGSKDRMLPPVYSRKAYDRARRLDFSQWKYSEHEGMAHSFGIDWKQVENWLLTKKKTVNPKRVSFATKDLNVNSAYWLEITGLKKYGIRARIDAVIDGQTIDVTTNNVSGYVLRLNSDLVDLTREIEIRENDAAVYRGVLSNGGLFVKAQKSKNAFTKRPGLSGPLWDAYSSSCVLVYGTNCEDDSLIKAAKRCASSFSDPRWMDKVHFRIIPDTTVTKQDLADNNLVLFGNESTNEILAKISKELPVQMMADTVVAEGREYSGENIGYVLIYPNPSNNERYVVIFAGSTENAIDCFNETWPRLNSTPKNIDVGIFEVDANGGFVKWRLMDVFDTDWDWPTRNSKSSSERQKIQPCEF